MKVCCQPASPALAHATLRAHLALLPLLSDTDLIHSCSPTTATTRPHAPIPPPRPVAAQKHFKEEFDNNYGELQTTQAKMAVNAPFKSVLKRTMENFNDPNADKLSNVQNQVDGVKAVMLENIDSLVNRQEKLENVEMKSQQINAQAAKFQKGSKQLASFYWWKDFKLKMMLCCIVLVVLYLIFAGFCGWGAEKCGNDGVDRSGTSSDAGSGSGNATALLLGSKAFASLTH